jgi:hypothetical protein
MTREYMEKPLFPGNGEGDRKPVCICPSVPAPVTVSKYFKVL